MTGMKEGAGEDPFATDTDDVQSDDTTGEEADSAAQTTETEESASRQSMQIPYKFRRSGVQDDRDRVPLFLQSETQTAERDALREMEDRFGGDVSLTDLREAVVKAGLDHLDDVEANLEEWGYGMSFEE